jgi:hypothetical protein
VTAPVRNPLVNGGFSYGSHDSANIRPTLPSKVAARVAAACTPACPAPTINTSNAARSVCVA